MRKMNMINTEELQKVTAGIGATHAPRRTYPVQRKPRIIVIRQNDDDDDYETDYDNICE